MQADKITVDISQPNQIIAAAAAEAPARAVNQNGRLSERILQVREMGAKGVRGEGDEGQRTPESYLHLTQSKPETKF